MRIRPRRPDDEARTHREIAESGRGRRPRYRLSLYRVMTEPLAENGAITREPLAFVEPVRLA